MKQSTDSSKRVGSPTLRQYMQQYNENKKRKGSGSTIAEPKQKKLSLFVVLEKLEEIERLVELNIQEDHLKLKFKERLLEVRNFLQKTEQKPLELVKEPSQPESEFATQTLKKDLLLLPKISSKIDIRTTYSGFLTSMNSITPKKSEINQQEKKLIAENSEYFEEENKLRLMKTKSKESAWRVTPTSDERALKENMRLGFKGNFREESNHFKSLTPRNKP